MAQQEMDQELRAQLDLMRREVETLHKVRVVGMKGKELRKFDGTEEAITFDEWKLEARSCLTKQDMRGEEAVSYLLSKLEGTARDEVRYTRATDRDTPEKVFDILEDAFGLRQSATQLMDNFFAHRQGDKDSIREYSHELMKLLGKVRKKDDTRISDPDVVLRDQFAEKLKDAHLRKELKKRIRLDNTLTFKQIREEAYQWEEDDEKSSPKKDEKKKSTSVHQVEATLQEATVEAAQVTKQSTEDRLMAMMKCQQEAFTKLADAMTKMTVRQNEVSANSGMNVNAPRIRRCFKCGSPDHFRRECPVRKAELAQRSEQGTQPPSQNRGKNSKQPSLNNQTSQ